MQLPHEIRCAMDFAKKLSLNPLQRLLFAGAARDTKVAEQVVAVGSRNRSPLAFFSPPLLLRAATAQRRSSPVATPV
jgi:hypothetical protein